MPLRTLFPVVAVIIVRIFLVEVGQRIRNARGVERSGDPVIARSVGRHVKNATDNHRRFLVHNQVMPVGRIFDIPVRGLCGKIHPLFGAGFFASLVLVEISRA